MDLTEIGEYDCESGQWFAYQAKLEEYFEANCIFGEYRLPHLLHTMGKEANNMLCDLANPRRVCVLRYEEVVNIMRDSLQTTMIEECDENNGGSGAAVNDATSGFEHLFAALQLAPPSPNRLARRAGRAAGSVGGSGECQASGSRFYNTSTDSSMQEQRPCTSCGRPDHKKEVCRHRNAVCGFCLLSGHLRRVCPDRYARAKNQGRVPTQWWN